MRDGAALLEGVAERLRIDVFWVAGPGGLVTGASVEADVDVVHVVTEREHAGTVTPDATKDDTPDGIGKGGAVGEGVEGARGLVGRVEVEGVVEERRCNAEELSGDEKGCDAVGGRREDIGRGARRRKRERKYAREEFFWEGYE
jgi:hypothetical protein